ncbi:hypothetical protein GQ53DRAFT_838556 [Thozetella sp. PMI_491]|nr:hypothetical protein GQ53DRAFT_838556 [Thozetella sp. PMI_491]
MSEDRLRLRLAVRRHGLPEVRVLFSAAVESEPTISKLLEQIDEVIPLESDDWGLEDYVVELRGPDGRGFECMHFEPVTKILQKDEEILIRPIFTEDRKKRRMSGREQISEDGKHLIDGIPFGRMRRKTPRDRPAINIPPLKKRRITYDAPDADFDSPDESQPLLLTEHGEFEDPASVTVSAAFEDADDEDDRDDDDEEDDDDGDFQDDELDDPDPDALEVDEDELQEELRGLQADNADLDVASPAPEEPTEGQGRQPMKDQSYNLGLEDLDNLTALRGAFPSAPLEACERMLLRCGNNLAKAYKKLRASFDAGKSLEEMLSHKELLAGHGDPPQREDSALQSEDSEAESVDSLTKHYDGNGFPSGSIDEGTASFHMADSLRQAGQDVKLPKRTVFADDTHTTGSSAESDESSSEVSSSSSDSDSEGDSSSGPEDESDSDDESDPEGQPSARQATTSDSEDDSSSSESDSDEGPEIASSKQPPRDNRRARAVDQVGSSSGESESKSDDDTDSSDSSEASSGDAEDISSDSSSDEDSDDSDSSSDSSSGDDSRMPLDKISSAAATKPVMAPETEVTPKAGKQTDGKDATTAPATPTTAPGHGLTTTQKRNARRRAAKAAARESLGASQASTPASGEEADPAIAARKAALLKTLETSQGDRVIAASEATVSTLKTHEAIKTAETAVGESKPSEEPSASSNVDTSNAPQPLEQGSPAATPTQRRSRLDLGAGRRMLFASLGLRNPKTKADEDKIRANLMKDVRPLVNPRISGEQAAPPPAAVPTTTEEVREEDPDAWREKIIYRAVECCQEGVELSEPPFPFVQRWDPQQQYNGQDRHGSRRKRKQRDHGYAEDEAERPFTKRRRSTDNRYWGPAEDDIVLNYDDEPTEDVVLATKDASPYAHIPEPPPLPADVSSLPELNVDRAFGGKCITGMAITWQQLLLSQETNWQPEVRTFSGTIVDADKDAQSLGVVLAKRDRAPEPEKEYDEQGNRIYGKFEAPDMDDEEDEGSEAAWGYRQIGFFELMQPRILKQPPVALEAAAEGAAVKDTVTEITATEVTSLPLATDVVADSTAPENSQPPSTSHSLDRLDTTNPESDESVVHDTYPIRTLADNSSSQLSPLGQTAALHGHDHTAEIIVDSNSREEGASLSDGPGPKLDSPSQQLEDMSEAAALASQRSSLAPSIPQPALAGSDRATRPTLAAVEEQDAALPGLKGGATPTRAPSAEFLSAVDPEADDIQSPPSSIPPGRQRDPGFSPDLGDDSLAMLGDSAEVPGSPIMDAVDPSPQLQAESTPIRQKARSPKMDSSPSSDASLPSLSEIWATAASSGNTQTPGKSSVMSAVQARKSGVLRDLEYEEAMRRLDEGDSDSDSASQPSGPGSKRQGGVKAEEASSQLSRTSGPSEKLNGTGRKGKARATKAELESSPPLATIPRKRKATPAGSQVISLISSSPEPDAAEVDAEDSKDESYDDDANTALGGRRRGKKRGAKSGFSARRVASLFSPVPAPKSGGNGNSRRRASLRF